MPRTTIKFVSLLLLTACNALAAPGTGAPREAILPDLLRDADHTWGRIHRVIPTYTSRELFTAMLAYAEANTNQVRMAKLLELAESMQNREEGHRALGNFRWYSHDSEIKDFNAVDFCMQHGALLWHFHQERIPPPLRERTLKLLKLGLQGLINHRPRSTYTNIALLNASDLILLGQALDAPTAVQEGVARLELFAKMLWEEGTHEFVSPSYYGVDVEALMLLAALAEQAETRELATILAAYFWSDIALNWHQPSQRLAGAHSRTYDYIYGFGGLDQMMTAYGWLSPPPKFRFHSFIPLYVHSLPRFDTSLNTRYPRLVEQTWGSNFGRSRTTRPPLSARLAAATSNHAPTAGGGLLVASW